MQTQDQEQIVDAIQLLIDTDNATTGAITQVMSAPGSDFLDPATSFSSIIHNSATIFRHNTFLKELYTNSKPTKGDNSVAFQPCCLRVGEDIFGWAWLR